METMKGTHKETSPDQVLDGHDMNQDIMQVLSYIHTHGVHTGKDGLFPSEHIIALGETFVRKYRAVEAKSPKRILNDAHMLQRLVHDFKRNEKRLEEANERLFIHDYYMTVIKKLNRYDEGLLCKDGSSYFIDAIEKMAHSMEAEANDAMKKPESFDDIEDNWTAKGNGLPFNGEFSTGEARN